MAGVPPERVLVTEGVTLSEEQVLEPARSVPALERQLRGEHAGIAAERGGGVDFPVNRKDER